MVRIVTARPMTDPQTIASKLIAKGGIHDVALRLPKDLRVALLGFDPKLPGIFLAGGKSDYATLCKLRRRGLARTDRHSGSYRGIFGWRWSMTAQGEAVRKLIEPIAHHPLCSRSTTARAPCDYDCARDYAAGLSVRTHLEKEPT